MSRSSEDKTDTPPSERWAWWVAVAGLATVVAEMAMSGLIAAHPEESWSIWVALLPMLPGIGAILAFLEWIRSLDELRQRIHFEGVAFAFVTTAVAVMIIGSFEKIGLPSVGWGWLWPVMGAAWLGGLALAYWRYR